MSIPLKTTEHDGVIRQVVLEDDSSLSERHNWQTRHHGKNVTMSIGGQSFDFESMTVTSNREEKRPYQPGIDEEIILEGSVSIFDPTMN